MRSRSTFALAVVGLLTGLAGCSSILNPIINPPSPLDGAWKLEAADALNLATTLTFDSNGAVTNVAYTVGDVASIPDDSPQAAVEIDGDNVVVSLIFGGNALVFSGTFNDDRSVISGRVTGVVSAGDVVVTLTNQAATLTKQ
ncbi:hypothetical protein RAS1_28810 [Phycisphaerae bacterium RAS1]|nr:hypothetical protein RAS1_28810 [Phycisphaerae bacterium RAS1]